MATFTTVLSEVQRGASELSASIANRMALLESRAVDILNQDTRGVKRANKGQKEREKEKARIDLSLTFSTTHFSRCKNAIPEFHLRYRRPTQDSQRHKYIVLIVV